MTYYDTLAEDLARAKEILAKGKNDLQASNLNLPPAYQELAGGTIYGGDTYAAYKLLESFVAEIERHDAERVFEAVVYAYEGRPVPDDLSSHGFVRRGEAFAATQRATLEALQLVLPIAEAYLAKAPGHPDNAKLETARAAIVKATRP